MPAGMSKTLVGTYSVQGLIKEQNLLLYLTKLGGDQSSHLYTFRQPIMGCLPTHKKLKKIILK